MTIFSKKIAKRKFEVNIVIRVGTMYFTLREPDSGLLIPVEHVGLVLDASITPTTFDITKAKTSISNMNFSLLDKNNIITDYIMQSEDSWIDRDVWIYLGAVNCSCSFTSYALLKKTKIKSFKKIANGYDFQTVDLTASLLDRVYTTLSTLTDDMTDSQNTIPLMNTENFATTGTVYINGEFLSYTGKTSIDLTGVSRGQESSLAESHFKGSVCYRVYFLEDHAIDIMLAVLAEANIPSDMIVNTMFQDIKDNQLSTVGDFKFVLFNIGNALTFLENELLLPTNTRFVIIEGKIGLTVLDESKLPTRAIGEDDIRGVPSYDVTGNNIINTVYVKYDYDHGRDTFLTTDIFTDDKSIDLYGAKSITFEYKGIHTTNGGNLTVSNRSTRLLSKLGFPIAKLSVSTHFTMFSAFPSEIINLSHRYLPARGRTLGVNDIMEITAVGASNLKNDPQMNIKCEYTSFGIFRVGIISPSPLIVSNTNQKIFEVPLGSLFEVGYKLVLFDSVNEEYYADAINTISAIDGNEITMVADFTTDLATAGVRVFFADYDECSEDQKNNYAFISPDTNEFLDEKDAYRIIF